MTQFVRDRKRRAGLRVEGRRPLSETRPDAVKLAQKLARKRPRGKKRSLQEIADELTKAGHMATSGRPFASMQVKRMLAQKLTETPAAK